MVVRIRLARFGRVNQPFYNIVVTQARTARNSKPIEVIGTYDPVPRQDPYDATTKPHKDIRLDSLRARYWVGVGAQPTDTVWRLLSMVGILQPKFRPNGTANTATAAKSLRTPASPAKAAAPAESS
ncbi:ribosomal protein S16 [Colletotrichum scovillei]|uniref:Ribosomal protein S16 n=2 Tax=Colletotrichum acutatum species complex TaxID=2707335 RepID=A0A9P7UCU1_9PEZI|nr:ribosomal protein S16 [Colletotrichum scovillei]KAG7056974.1 ribosomal protein S16 [Colletotrichum scovillei]KAG7066906.1 ribosomal protein S16 [Colletotrichum scovillei]KXH34646.1 ribosomal protein S16 [Colletotrichum nymphaeae SA-01]